MSPPESSLLLLHKAAPEYSAKSLKLENWVSVTAAGHAVRHERYP